MKNYSLKHIDSKNVERLNSSKLLKKFVYYLRNEEIRLILAIMAVLINATANVASPLILGLTIDQFILHHNLSGIAQNTMYLSGLYLLIFISGFAQTRFMGEVGRNVLFKLRSAVFEKIQSLPQAFFNQNKLGDLISRINNDTDKLNQFLSQSLNQFVANFFTILGIGMFIFFINFKLALITIISALILFLVSYLISPWISKKNRINLQSLGNLSAEIQESINNYKVIVSFNRKDYFRNNFEKANEENFKSAVAAGIANNISAPIYDLSGNVALILVLYFGILMIKNDELTIGLLVSFLSYTDRFYSPLRQMAAIWSNAQASLAAWSRVWEILSLHSDLKFSNRSEITSQRPLMEFQKVSFGYVKGHRILNDVNFEIETGKTYAVVGPTGGGKSTLAALMARLYDPKRGTIYLKGQDLKSFLSSELTQTIGFILQDQFLFTGTVGENIVYGNKDYPTYDKDKLTKQLANLNLSILINKFENGLDTLVTPTTELISMGQKQLISFIRAIIRKPEILIMDEATANIDTVTESILQDILDKLPKETTKVIIAHRLNTIKKADQIYFVSHGQVIPAESFEKSLELINKTKVDS